MLIRLYMFSILTRMTPSAILTTVSVSDVGRSVRVSHL